MISMELPDLGLFIRARGEETGGRLTIIESRGMAPGDGPPAHVHANEDEAFLVIDGSYTWIRGEERVEAGPGAFIWLPRGVAHTFIVGPAGGRMIHLYMPGGIDRYFATWQEAITREGDAAPIRALAASYGITYGP
jgi:quercetin dioxygenase-like cupin family protein